MFLFNDFELISFSIYLDKLNWNNKPLSPEDFLFVLAMAVKLKLSNDIEHRYKIFSKDYPELFSKYEKWRNENEAFSRICITDRDLNKKFKILSRV